ncbi:pentapeptide repeat-containing protein [Nisaea sp.]|uniref:pentapeptide repeat-containing protein n=1 Tax=Nisaea sp. TaxID=2024842 RepID=UPI003296C16C
MSFEQAYFGDGQVSFRGAVFNNIKVYFNYAIFGEGDGDGDVSFEDARFRDGDVSFEDAKFGDAEVSFKNAEFGNGDVSFYRVTFGDGAVSFGGATFGIGNVYFMNAYFGDLGVSFDGSTFAKGFVSFRNATFGKGGVTFNKATFADLIFIPMSIASCGFSGDRMKVNGSAEFCIPVSNAFKRFKLRGATFDGPLILEGKLKAPPDLRGVKTAHHVELSGLSVELKRDSIFPFWPLSELSRVASDREDAAKLRRLKEIAEANRDHHAALRFSADENRARRWIETPWPASILDMIFSVISNYGQSILRPFGWLCLLGVIAAMFYRCAACPAYADCWQAARLSLSNSLPFLPQSRTLRLDASEALYGETTSLWVDSVMVFQGTASFVLLFLIGLGLRNRFRL